MDDGLFSIFTENILPMSEDNLPYLNSEIARLNRIIEALLNQVEYLRQENTYLKHYNASGKHFYTHVNNEKGIENNSDTHVNTEIGTKNNSDTIPNFEMGIEKHSATHDKNKVGSEINFSGIHNSDIGSKIDSAGSSAFGGSALNKPPSLPEKIEANPSNASAMAGYMKQAGFVRVSREGILNSALLLLHFYNKGAGDHATLRKISGMSAGGLAKRMGSLRKRALITRKSNKIVELTDVALQIIHATFGKK